MALRVIDKSCQIVMFRGKLFSTDADMEFQAKNLQKHFVTTCLFFQSKNKQLTTI